MAARAATGAAPKRRGPRPRPDRTGTIPERLTYLFDTVRKPNGRPFSAAEVARAIAADGGKISSVYILKIRNGERLHPAQTYLDLLAGFFTVSPTFFTEQHPAASGDEHSWTEIGPRSEEAQSFARRIARLSPRSRDALSTIIDRLLDAEGRGAAGSAE